MHPQHHLYFAPRTISILQATALSGGDTTAKWTLKGWTLLSETHQGDDMFLIFRLQKRPYVRHTYKVHNVLS
jgi:hypothetical protein